MAEQVKRVEFFGLSTCGWCRKTREWLDEHKIVYEVVYVDKLSGDEKDAVKEKLLEHVSRLSFPVVVVDQGADVIQGFKPDRLEECLQ